MRIIRDLSSRLLNESATVHDAFSKFETSGKRTLICCDYKGEFIGVLTFGDLNRFILRYEGLELNQSILPAINKAPFYATDDEGVNVSKLNLSFECIPLLDAKSHVVGYLENSDCRRISLGERILSEEHAPLIIAEIGNNHNGSVARAKELVDLAVDSGADCVKFQMRSMESLYGKVTGENQKNLGNEYTLDLLKRFQLNTEDLLDVLSYVKNSGVIPLCTPWDIPSVGILDEFGIEGFKVASADLTNHMLLQRLARTGKPLFCSTGMSTEKEIEESVGVLNESGATYALLHCNSAYPAPFRDINLRYLERLKDLGGCVVGYSGHERGINVAVASVAMGARIIEKHFTLDRSLEGNDHKVSLLPNEFKTMVSAIDEVFESLGTTQARTVTQGEMLNRITLAKSIYAARDLCAGALLTDRDVAIKSPGHGLQPNHLSSLMNRPLGRSLKQGEVFHLSDIVGLSAELDETVEFQSNWGIPVRHHDFNALYDKFSPKMLEFHLSYSDLSLNTESYFKDIVEADLVVHAPELFERDHILDLASLDEEYRKESVTNLWRTISMVRDLRQQFRPCRDGTRTCLVVNVGGFSLDSPLDSTEIVRRTEVLVNTLKLFDVEDVELIPQTMPPFPWHFGGQRYHNLFLDSDWIKTFCDETKSRVCLDISHSALRCNQTGFALDEFLADVLPYTAHLHLADARSLSDEGLQIGDGDIDWRMVVDKITRLQPDASWLPEIWQGHENSGFGFLVAFSKLKQAGMP